MYFYGKEKRKSIKKVATVINIKLQGSKKLQKVANKKYIK